MTQKIKPEPVDSHVGQQLRKLRHLRGMSQSDLAQAAGITFQQVQKYENGTNRVSASRLHLFARILKVLVSAFFEGIDEPAAEPLPTGRGAAQILRLYEEPLQKHFLNLMAAVVESQSRT